MVDPVSCTICFFRESPCKLSWKLPRFHGRLHGSAPDPVDPSTLTQFASLLPGAAQLPASGKDLLPTYSSCFLDRPRCVRRTSAGIVCKRLYTSPVMCTRVVVAVGCRFTSRFSGANLHRSANGCLVLDELLLLQGALGRAEGRLFDTCVRTNE